MLTDISTFDLCIKVAVFQVIKFLIPLRKMSPTMHVFPLMEGKCSHPPHPKQNFKIGVPPPIILKLSVFPQEFKFAKLKLIFKKGSKTTPKSYRPI